jgi:Peptidase family S41
MHHAQSVLLSIVILLSNLTSHALTDNSHSIFPQTAMSYFNPLAGKWEGELEYSDYQSGKRVKLKTITFTGDTLTILKETRRPLRFRHQYTFKRSQETSAVEQTFSAAQLAEDFSLFKRALKQLHPGLYRYNSPAQLERRFNQLEARLKSPTTDGELFRLLAEFVSQIKCGHTYLNPLNQPKAVRARFLEGRTYLPFYFRLIDRKMIITGNLSSQKLSKGSEIIRINGVSTARIIDRLLTVTTADGTNTTGTRLKSIELGIPRENTHQLFDIYFPLFFPVPDRVYSIEAVERSTNKRIKFQVTAMTRTERFAETQKRYGVLPTYDDDWRFEIQADNTAYLKVPHSLTWRLKKVDYQKLIANAFAEMKAKKVRVLIIDWRGNDGGDEAVGMLVASYLSARPIDCYDRKTRYVKSTKVDDDLFKYLTFYDEDLKQGLQKGLPPSQFQLSDNNLFRVLGDPPCQPLQAQANNFQGRAFVIADASNVSASFQFLRAVRDNKLATIVGQPSGGNLQGINGDSYGLLSLPNSRFEIDIPLYFQDPLTVQPDGGIVPDHLIKPSVDDIVAGIDAELNFILKSRE